MLISSLPSYFDHGYFLVCPFGYIVKYTLLFVLVISTLAS